ncbi:MAG: hypothetical protein WAO76_08810 [Georgfuchsia sp.]
MPLLTILFSDLAGNEIADGAGLNTFVRNLGASFSASITIYVWNHRAIIHHAQLSESIIPSNATAQAAVTSLGHGNMQLAMTKLDTMISRQAYQIAFNEIYLGLSIVVISMIFLLWLAKPPFFKAASSAPSGEP